MDNTIETFFPPSFRRAVQANWKNEANTRLNGVMASIASTSKPSEENAINFLKTRFRVHPFLNEKSIQTLIFQSQRGSTGSVVDFVSTNSSKTGLILVEAKPQLDSATLRKQPPEQKFGHTISQLNDFYRRGGETAPSIDQLIITVRKIAISGHSRWDVEGGLLTYEGNVVKANDTDIKIQVVELTASPKSP